MIVVVFILSVRLKAVTVRGEDYAGLTETIRCKQVVPAGILRGVAVGSVSDTSLRNRSRCDCASEIEVKAEGNEKGQDGRGKSHSVEAMK